MFLFMRKCRRSFSTKHEIRWFLIAGTSNRALVGDFPSRIAAAYAMANALQLKSSSFFGTGRNDNFSLSLDIILKFR